MQNKKVLIKAKHTNNSYYNINTLNAVETAELQSIVNKYNNHRRNKRIARLIRLQLKLKAIRRMN